MRATPMQLVEILRAIARAGDASDTAAWTKWWCNSSLVFSLVMPRRKRAIATPAASRHRELLENV